MAIVVVVMCLCDKIKRVRLLSRCVFPCLRHVLGHVPYSKRVHIEVFTLGVVKKKCFAHRVEEVEVPRVHKRQPLVLLPYLVILRLQVGLPLEGQSLQGVNYKFRVGQEAALSKSKRASNLPESFREIEVASDRTFAEYGVDRE